MLILNPEELKQFAKTKDLERLWVALQIEDLRKRYAKLDTKVREVLSYRDWL